MKKIIDKFFSKQMIRFLFVGGLNTLVGYGIYALLIYLNVNYLIANTLSTIIGVIHSYLWNRYFTFKSKQKATKEITKFVSVYITSYLIGTCTLYLFKSVLNISPYIAGLINLVITTLISYFGHKYISFKENNMNIRELSKKLKEKITNIDRGPTKLEWTVLIIILIFCFLCFNHGDITATATHGRDLLVATLEGNFFGFYDYTQSTAVYLIPIYIIFAIWSIPVVIIFKIFSITMCPVAQFYCIHENFLLLMWYKLLPTLFTLLTAKLLVKIAKEIGLDEVKQKWIPFIFLSFPPLIFSQFIFGQYDSICMFFTTLSIYYFLKKDYYKFSLIMSLAITFKLFPLFIFIPLIFLSQKKLIDIIKHFAIGLTGTLLCNLLFIASPAFNTAKDFTGGMMGRFFLSNIPTFSGSVSIFLLIFIAICVYAYNKKIDENNKLEFAITSIYLGFAAYSAFFTFVLWHPQWFIIIAPFMILSLFINDKEKTTLILFLVISAMYLCIVVKLFPKNVDENLMNFGLIVRILNRQIPNEGLLYQMLPGKDSFIPTLFVSSMIINTLMKFPTKERVKLIEKNIKEKVFDVEKGYLLMTVLPIFVYIIPTLYLYFVYYK